MSQRLEFHADHERFFVTELDKLAAQVLPMTWRDLYEVLSEEANERFDQVPREFCSQLEWPPLQGHELARACARLHFSVWAAWKQPWESTEEPVDGQRYLRRMLIDRYWMYRHQWISEAFAGIPGEDKG